MRVPNTALLLLLGSLAGAPAALADVVVPPPPPAGPAQSVEVSLAVEKPLALVRGAGEARPHLAGVLVAIVKNASDRPLRLRDLQEHGFVFVAPDGRLEALVHSCKCVKDAVEPEGAVFVLAPGKERKVAVDDWGCGGGSWQAPPAGRYRLEYRVLPAPEPPPAAAAADPKVQVPACRRALASEAFWEGAARSKPLAIELKEAPRGRQKRP